MAFQKGHEITRALTDEKCIKDAYKAYCAHLIKGKGKQGFFWKDKKSDQYATWKIMERTMRTREDICPPHMYENAMAIYYEKWERMGDTLREESGNRHNMRFYELHMRNRFHWDKPDKDVGSTVHIHMDEGKIT